MRISYTFSKQGTLHTTEYDSFRLAIYQAERDYATGNAEPVRIRDEFGNVFGSAEIEGYVKYVIPLWSIQEIAKS